MWFRDLQKENYVKNAMLELKNDRVIGQSQILQKSVFSSAGKGNWFEPVLASLNSLILAYPKWRVQFI